MKAFKRTSGRPGRHHHAFLALGVVGHGAVCPVVAFVLLLVQVQGVAAKVPSDPVRFSGTLLPSTVAEIEAQLSREGGPLIITSSGGDGLAAIRLANFIHAHKIAVRAEGYCLSSCANYVLPASSDASLGPNVLLGFHSTFTSMYEASKSQDPILAEKLYGAAVRLEQELYRRIGISEAMLLIPAHKVKPICAFIKGGPASPPLAYFISKYTFYIPSRLSLLKFGYRVRGEIADTQERLKSAAQNIPQGVQMAIKLEVAGEDGEITPNQIRHELQKMPRCSQIEQARAERIDVIPH
jgi:hypothetical protein